MSSGLIDLEEFYLRPLNDFGSSFNFFVGTANKELDFFDNPYMTVNVYELDENYTPTLTKDVILKKCDKEKDLMKFVDPNLAAYYPNALCF